MADTRELEARFWKHLGSDRTVMLGATGIAPRPMTAIAEDDQAPLWFFTASDTELGAALDSEVAQAELTGMTNIGRSADNVEGTPSFFINGRNAEVTAWPALKSKLDLALKAA